ncbi:hypothetical protein [Spirosoma pollinicola]|uniref:hypothetical protein n=1 Tax=Spirosoma pollinicola TaxID=2057025 RepID=UPI0012FD4FCE|nr:hypothetical protein [Spirosoma pollinicola]
MQNLTAQPLGLSEETIPGIDWAASAVACWRVKRTAPAAWWHILPPGWELDH